MPVTTVRRRPRHIRVTDGFLRPIENIGGQQKNNLHGTGQMKKSTSLFVFVFPFFV